VFGSLAQNTTHTFQLLCRAGTSGTTGFEDQFLSALPL
jgi:hypothetical protein